MNQEEMKSIVDNVVETANKINKSVRLSPNYIEVSESSRMAMNEALKNQRKQRRRRENFKLL
jgi:hypothetical protein